MMLAIGSLAAQCAVGLRLDSSGQDGAPKGIIFDDAIEATAYDRGLLDAFKCFCNYAFYKFGLEISLITMVYSAWCRMDVLAAVLLAFVLVLGLAQVNIVRYCTSKIC